MSNAFDAAFDTTIGAVVSDDALQASQAFVDRLSAPQHGPPVTLLRSGRHPCDRWTSSLAHEDLDRLLHIIEDGILPQLVERFTPARCSPLASRSTRKG